MSMSNEVNDQEAAATKPLRPIHFIGVVVVMTLAGSASGVMFGRWLSHSLQTPGVARTSEVAHPAAPPQSATLYDLPPIIGNLANPPNVWVRIQASIVLAEQKPGKLDVLAARIAEDVLAFVRTLSLTDLSGASGLQHFRDDLNERAQARSDGRVRELILQTLVVQ
ncbi:flagellar basal body-associated FliL family protein [Methylocella sp.]|uniref:flagellar basal body-associated FliL family protein n=1 Tax=Methylocella sp. TaxID=1978226 RepID=UPI00378512F6